MRARTKMNFRGSACGSRSLPMFESPPIREEYSPSNGLWVARIPSGKPVESDELSATLSAYRQNLPTRICARSSTPSRFASAILEFLSALAFPNDFPALRSSGVRTDIIHLFDKVRANSFHQEPDKIESRLVRINHSSRNSQKRARAASGLAATTTRSPGASNRRCKRQISRNLRRTRLRVTASPKRREVINPKRVPPPAGSRTTLKRNNRPCAEHPCDRTKANSRLSLMRAARGKPSFSGLGVPGVWNLDTLGQQAFATALTTAAKNRAAALRFHPSAKTELALARALAWLIGAFHNGKNGARKNTLLAPRVNSGNLTGGL